MATASSGPKLGPGVVATWGRVGLPGEDAGQSSHPGASSWWVDPGQGGHFCVSPVPRRPRCALFLQCLTCDVVSSRSLPPPPLQRPTAGAQAHAGTAWRPQTCPCGWPLGGRTLASSPSLGPPLAGQAQGHWNSELLSRRGAGLGLSFVRLPGGHAGCEGGGGEPAPRGGGRPSSSGGGAAHCHHRKALS